MNAHPPTPLGPGPRPGDTVLGCFRLERQIGAGSFAVAYLAEQLGTDRRAVVKLPHPHLLHGPNGPELRRRFDAEAKAATRAKHPNLVTVYVVGETQYGVPAIAMEYIVGESLHDRLTRAAPLPEPELVALGCQLADALASLHAVGIVHRDLSPANVLLTEAPDRRMCAKLLDFGVAKLLDAPARTLGPMGTPGYLAPEQLLGRVTPRADVFSLGAVLWWALTGREREDDFHDGSLRESLGRRIGPDPRALRPDAPRALAELVSRALIPEPLLRPTMTDLLAAWRAAAAAPRSEAAPRRTLVQTARIPPASERLSTARTPASLRVALVLSNPVMCAQLSGYLQDHSQPLLTRPSARELGRASPGEYELAILDEQLPDVDTAALLVHLRGCYPELRVVIVGFADHRRREWLDLGAHAFLRMPDELDALGPHLSQTKGTLATRRGSHASTVDPEPRLRAELIERMRTSAPRRLATSLETFIGCVPEWIARVERQLGEPGGDGSRRACRDLIIGAESVGATNLATLARATYESLAAGDLATARVFLAAAEREYFEVFQEAFTLLNQLSPADALP